MPFFARVKFSHPLTLVMHQEGRELSEVEGGLAVHITLAEGTSQEPQKAAL